MLKLKEGSLYDKFNEYGTFVLKNGLMYDLENKEAINACIEVFDKNEIGLTIVGNPGSGKTLFFDMIQKIINPKSSQMFIKVNVLDVVLDFNNKEVGHKVFRKWESKNVFFDDLGTEDKGYLFGEKVEVFEKFIQFRYELFRKFKLKTHFTTNLSKEEMNNRYGMRCISRLNEMCERVVLGGSVNYTDRRQYKNFIALPPVLHEQKEDEKTKWVKEWYEQSKQEAQNKTTLGRETLGQRMKKVFGT